MDWFYPALGGIALLGLAAAFGISVLMERRKRDPDYLPDYWDFTEHKQEERL